MLLAALAEHDVTLLALSGTNHGWEFTLRFPDRETTKAFQTTALNAGHSLSITGMSDSGRRGTSMDRLTPAQREVLTLAFDRGYFEIPRQATLVNLAEEIGVSDQAASERLRRAQAKLGRAAVSAERS